MGEGITNEQLFEFMTKMYGEMQEMRENMATKQDIVRLENKMDTNHRALYDGYKLIKKDPRNGTYRASPELCRKRRKGKASGLRGNKRHLASISTCKVSFIWHKQGLVTNLWI